MYVYNTFCHQYNKENNSDNKSNSRGNYASMTFRCWAAILAFTANWCHFRK